MACNVRQVAVLNAKLKTGSVDDVEMALGVGVALQIGVSMCACAMMTTCLLTSCYLNPSWQGL